MREIADEAKEDLKMAMPAMEAAQNALKALNKADINELKAFQKPPALVRFVMEPVCILLGAKLVLHTGNTKHLNAVTIRQTTHQILGECELSLPHHFIVSLLQVHESKEYFWCTAKHFSVIHLKEKTWSLHPIPFLKPVRPSHIFSSVSFPTLSISILAHR